MSLHQTWTCSPCTLHHGWGIGSKLPAYKEVVYMILPMCTLNMYILYLDHTRWMNVPAVIPDCPLLLPLQVLWVPPHTDVTQHPPKQMIEPVPLLGIRRMWVTRAFQKLGRQSDHARGAEAVWAVVLPTQYWAPRGSLVSPGVCAHCATTKIHNNYTTFCMLLCELIIQSINLPCSLGALVSALVPGGFGASSHLSERWQPGGES